MKWEDIQKYNEIIKSICRRFQWAYAYRLHLELEDLTQEAYEALVRINKEPEEINEGYVHKVIRSALNNYVEQEALARDIHIYTEEKVRYLLMQYAQRFLDNSFIVATNYQPRGGYSGVSTTSIEESYIEFFDLRAALHRLPMDYKEVIERTYLQQEKQSEIAEAMNISQPAVCKMLDKAVDALWQELQNKKGETFGQS